MSEDIENFESFLLNKLRPHIEEEIEKGGGKKVINKVLYDEEVEFNDNKTEGEKFLAEALFYFTEAEDALKRSKMASIFIKQYPYKKTLQNNNITKIDCVNYHLSSFLNECYIFQERILDLIKLIGENSKNMGFAKEWKEAEKLQKNIIKSLGYLTGTESIRGLHVHKRDYSDKEIRKSKFLESLAGENLFSELYESSYRETRREKSKAIKRENENLEKILAMTSKKIKPITEKIYKKKSEQE